MLQSFTTKKYDALAVGLLLLTGCTINIGRGSDEGIASQVLSDLMEWPMGTTSLEDPQTDTDTAIYPSSGGSSAQVVLPGNTLNLSASFRQSKIRIDWLGVRLGDSGKIMVVPSRKSGTTLTASLKIPLDVCGMLSNGCHDIDLYEFVVTAENKVSTPARIKLALRCGEALSSAMCGGSGPGPGP